VAFTKWGGRPHWTYDALALGADEHGSWLAVPTGTVITRPGARIVTAQPQLVLAAAGAGWVATFYAHGPGVEEPPVEVYVDVTTPAEVTAEEIRAVDLDLDVLRGLTGRVWVDDEDEFAAHREAYGYPPEVVTAALAACADLQRDLSQHAPPFDAATARHWWARSRP